MHEAIDLQVVDGDAWSNRLTREMAMHEAIDLQKDGWIRVGSVKFWKWLLDVGSSFWSCFEMIIECSF